MFASGESLSLLGAVSTPTYAVAFERRVGPRTWLGLNASGSYETRELPIIPADEPPVRPSVQGRTLSGSFLLGMRHEIAHGLVDVSIFAAGVISAQRIRQDSLRSSESFVSYQYLPSNTRTVGLVAGLTVERELVEALALRLSLDMASVSFSRATIETMNGIGGSPASLSSRRFGIAIRPGLKLHFYF